MWLLLRDGSGHTIKHFAEKSQILHSRTGSTRPSGSLFRICAKQLPKLLSLGTRHFGSAEKKLHEGHGLTKFFCNMLKPLSCPRFARSIEQSLITRRSLSLDFFQRCGSASRHRSSTTRTSIGLFAKANRREGICPGYGRGATLFACLSVASWL